MKTLFLMLGSLALTASLAHAGGLANQPPASKPNVAVGVKPTTPGKINATYVVECPINRGTQPTSIKPGKQVSRANLPVATKANQPPASKANLAVGSKSGVNASSGGVQINGRTGTQVQGQPGVNTNGRQGNGARQGNGGQNGTRTNQLQ